MNIDEAKAAWTDRAGDPPGFGGVLEKIRRTERFELTILRRDVLETLVAVGVAIFFSSTLSQRTGWLEWLGTVVIVLGAIEIVVVLNVVRMRGGRAPVDSSIRDYCLHELARTNRQITLLKNVAWWYLGPLAAGLFMIEFGSDKPLPDKLVIVTTLSALFYGVYRLNLSAIRKSLVPMKSSLEETIASLDQA